MIAVETQASTRSLLVATVLVAVGGFSIAGCAPSLDADDPRPGSYNGTIFGCIPVPLSAGLYIRSEGYAYFSSRVNGDVQSGSQPGTVGGAAHIVRFDYVRNSLGDLTGYSVDGTLSDDRQTVSGIVSYWTQNRHEQRRTDGPPGCRFSLRRARSDTAYIDTSIGDFSCATEIGYMYPADGSAFGRPDDSMSVPRPSCFDGELYAVRVLPMASGRYEIRAGTSQGTFRSAALFSACDGREIACNRTDEVQETPWDQPALDVRLTQFQDVLLVLDRDIYMEYKFIEY